MLREAKLTKAMTELHQGSPFGPHFHQLIKGTAWTHMLGSAKAAPGCSSSFAKEMTHSFLSDLCRHFRLLTSSADGPHRCCELPQTGAPGIKPQPSWASWTHSFKNPAPGLWRGCLCTGWEPRALKAFISYPEKKQPREKEIQMRGCNFNWVKLG